MNKRLFAILLAGLMMLPAFTSCSDTGSGDTTDNPTPSTVDTAADETEAAVSDDLPDVTYNGYEYMIYNSNAESNDWYTTTFVTFEEDSADTIPSAIFNRNLMVEERFDVTIAESYQDNNQIIQSIQASSGDFDIALLKGDGTISMAQSGYLRDLNKLDYLNFTKPYWDNKAAEHLTISGKLYMGVGDFMTTHIDETIVTFFNKGLVDKYGLESPYKLVNDMAWTYDKMAELGKKACMDEDGNGVYDDNDSYALMSWRGVLYPYLIYGSGESYITKDENDVPQVTFFNDRFISVYEKILSICHADGDTFLYDADLKSNTKGLSNNHRVQEIMFPNNQVLFWVECVSWSKALRDMDTDFGIIPAPMMDTEQGQYYNYVNSNFYAPSIPTSVQDVDRACIILEALNSASTNTVLKAYYDISLKGKSSRDEESHAMLDIIFNNRLYDTSIVFQIASINSTVYQKASDNDADLASFYNKNRKSMNKQTEKVASKLAEHDY